MFYFLPGGLRAVEQEELLDKLAACQKEVLMISQTRFEEFFKVTSKQHCEDAHDVTIRMRELPNDIRCHIRL